MNKEFESLPKELKDELTGAVNEIVPCRNITDVCGLLDTREDGKAKSTIKNFKTILQNDPKFRGAIRRNIFTERDDIVRNLGWPRTTIALCDTDEAYICEYMETNYGISNLNKIKVAIRTVANDNAYHPVRDYLESLSWDGESRIRHCLHHFLGAKEMITPRRCLSTLCWER